MNSCGYVDLQINGNMGVDFSDPKLTEDMLMKAAEHIFAGGADLQNAAKAGEKGCLVSSSASMKDCADYFRSLGIATEEEIQKMSRINPLKMLGQA